MVRTFLGGGTPGCSSSTRSFLCQSPSLCGSGSRLILTPVALQRLRRTSSLATAPLRPESDDVSEIFRLLQALNGYDGALVSGFQALTPWKVALNHPTASDIGLLNASV